MTERKCGNCEYHDSFSGACFNGRSRNCADFTDDSNVCSVWEIRTTAEEHDVQRNKERVASTKKIVSQRAEGKTCNDCAKFVRDTDSFKKSGGWCPIPRKNKAGIPIEDRKYVCKGKKACRYFEDKGDGA